MSAVAGKHCVSVLRRLVPCFVAFLAVLGAAGCGGGGGGGSIASVGSGSGSSGSGSGGSGSGSGSGGSGGASNVATIVVDAGPTGASGIINTPFVSVTICVPGTSNCQTIDHVSVDTGSTGFRVLGAVLTSTLANALQPAANTQNQPYYECVQFADGYIWGPVTAADVKIAGETASNIPIHVIGSTQVPVPSGCSSGAGQAENTVSTFGANGILGIAQFHYDCDAACATAPPPQQAYFSCTSNTSTGTCTATVMALAQQVPNPVFAFPTDNNGTIIALPSLSNAGGVNPTGQLIFGIDTQGNNALGSATLLKLDSAGNFSASVNGQTLADGAFIDSGSNAYFFPDTGTTVCSSTGSKGFYCPASMQSLSATVSSNGVTATVPFLVQSADTLFAGNGGTNTGFNDLAGPTTIPGGPTNNTHTNFFDFGLPFFYGRSVYTALEGKTASAGAGPFNAYR